MRRLALLLVLLAGGALAATGITLVPTVRFEFTDCAAAGSTSQTVTAGTYVFRITDSDVWLCWGATCGTGGERFPQNTVLLLNVPASQAFSCRSAGSTGDAIFTRGQ